MGDEQFGDLKNQLREFLPKGDVSCHPLHPALPQYSSNPSPMGHLCDRVQKFNKNRSRDEYPMRRIRDRGCLQRNSVTRLVAGYNQVRQLRVSQANLK